MLDRLEDERHRSASAALEAQERERARVARDLHDEVNQSLTGLLLRLEALRSHAPPELSRELDETRDVASQAMQELLSLARQLRPSALDDLGLNAALAGLVEEVNRTADIRARFETDENTTELAALPDDVQLVTYRVAQEALSNAIQHSGAKNVRVRLLLAEHGLELRISDDGRGFTAEDRPALGIAGMRERALLIGGLFDIETRPGLGTRVTLRLPDADREAAAYHAEAPG
jgi:two-component system sensor histidine kinase UhpB